jgi:predicted transcriptional regulator
VSNPEYLATIFSILNYAVLRYPEVHIFEILLKNLEQTLEELIKKLPSKYQIVKTRARELMEKLPKLETVVSASGRQMVTTNYDKIITSEPINKTAAVVTRYGGSDPRK